MSVSNRLRALFDVILDEVEVNPKFGKRVEAVLRGAARSARPPTAKDETRSDASTSPRPSSTRSSTRRPPAVFDPMEKFSEGEDALRTHLAALDVEQLKDMIAEYGMDTARLAMKWKSTDRLVDFILETVRSRARRGDAFRAQSGSAAEAEPRVSSGDASGRSASEEAANPRAPESLRHDQPPLDRD